MEMMIKRKKIQNFKAKEVEKLLPQQFYNLQCPLPYPNFLGTDTVNSIIF